MITPKHIKSVVLFICGLILFALPPASFAQDIPPTVPPDADPTAGLQIYRQRCANCHGEIGLGDGPLADQLPNPPTAIGSPAYLDTADPSQIFATIQQGNVLAGMPAFGEGGNSDPLSNAQIWDIVAGLYTLDQFSQPIESARISGRVTNGTTGETIPNTIATLQAFTSDFTSALQLETTTDSDGRYTFDLTDIPPDWFYRTVATYEGLDFTSDFVPLTPFITDIALPITVYNGATSDEGVSISQLEVIFTFGGDRVQVAEFYTFSHSEDSVYVGETGDYRGGTLRLPIPENAENITILRNVGGVADFVPMDEQTIVTSPTERRLAWPLSPGQAGLRLLVRYTYPYDRALDFSHPIPYPVENLSAIMPDNGVSLSNTDWEQQEITYSETNDPALTRIRFTPSAAADPTQIQASLNGFPQLILDESGQLITARDEQQELIIGLIALLITVAAVGGLAYSWRTTPPAPNDQDELLQQLAALDLAYQEKQINRAPYQRRRAQLKEQLQTIWE